MITIIKKKTFYSRRAENLFWDHFISWVAFGIQDLRLKPPPQLPMIQALFLSRMALAIANHEKGIEATCCRILLARPAARLNHIPELKTFLTALYVYIYVINILILLIKNIMLFISVLMDLKKNHFIYAGFLK